MTRANSIARRKEREAGIIDKATEIKVDAMLKKAGVEVSQEGLRELYDREAPKDEDDSTIKPEPEPVEPPPGAGQGNVGTPGEEGQDGDTGGDSDG